MWQFLSERNLDAGCVFAYFPRVPEDLDALDLDGGLFSQEERHRREGDWTSIKKTRLLVKSFLANGPDRLALLHASSLRAGRTFPFSLLSPLGYVRRNKEVPSEFPTEVYVYLPGGEISMDDVNYFIETAPFWSMTSALTSSSPGRLISEAEVDSRFIQDRAAKTEHILMNACDGDITLVWSADKVLQDKLVACTAGS